MLTHFFFHSTVAMFARYFFFRSFPLAWFSARFTRYCVCVGGKLCVLWLRKQSVPLGSGIHWPFLSGEYRHQRTFQVCAKTHELLAAPYSGRKERKKIGKKGKKTPKAHLLMALVEVVDDFLAHVVQVIIQEWMHVVEIGEKYSSATIAFWPQLCSKYLCA